MSRDQKAQPDWNLYEGPVLCTSQPPLVAQFRTLVSGIDVTQEYAAFCNSSWHRSFTSVLSVNSIREVGLGVETVAETVRYTSTDLLEITGKPVVLLDDLLTAAPKSDPVGLVNADVFLNPGNVTKSVSGLREGEFLAEQRTDVSVFGGEGGEQTGAPYPHGFDFFIISRAQAQSILGTRFAIGVPWWDHFVPIALILDGARPAGTGAGTACSLRHEERWEQRVWLDYGRYFVKVIAARVSLVHLRKSPLRPYVMVILTSAVLLALLRKESHIRRILRRISRANMALIAESRESSAE